MSRIWITAVITAGLLYVCNAMAIGLGNAVLHSALNQPMNATIELKHISHVQANLIKASLGSAKDFQRLNIQRPNYLNDLKFKTIKQGNTIKIQIVSSKPMNEPYLDFLVQVRWPKGRLLREYVFLLDPPAVVDRLKATQPATIATQSATTATQSATTATQPVTTTTTQQSTYTTHGNEELLTVAIKLLPEGVTRAKMMMALRAYNPNAFISDRKEILKGNIVLVVPNKNEIKTFSEKKIIKPTHKKNNSNNEEKSMHHAQKVTNEPPKHKQLKAENERLNKAIVALQTKVEALGKEKTKRTENISNTAKQPKKEAVVTKIKATLLTPSIKDQSVASLNKKEILKMENKKTDIQLVSKKLVQKHQDNAAPNTQVVKNVNKKLTSFYDDMIADLYYILLAIGGIILAIIFVWKLRKKVRQRKENEAMDKLLAEEAQEAEQEESGKEPQQKEKQTSASQKKHKKREEDAQAFSSLIHDHEKNNEKPMAANMFTPESEKKELQNKATAPVMESNSFNNDALEEQIDTSVHDEQNNRQADQTVPEKKNVVNKNAAPHSEGRSSISSTLSFEKEGERATSDSETTLSSNAKEESSETMDLAEQLEHLDEELDNLAEDDVALEKTTPVTNEENEVYDIDNESIPSMLDLARAYLEMGDTDEMKKILQRVLERGNQTQIDEANELLSRC